MRISLSQAEECSKWKSGSFKQLKLKVGKLGTNYLNLVGIEVDAENWEKAKTHAQMLKENPISDEKFFKTSCWRELEYKRKTLNNGKCSKCGVYVKDCKEMKVKHKVSRKTRPDLELELNNTELVCPTCKPKRKLDKKI